jgi:hypothetical protein
MNSPEIRSFINKHSDLFWYIPADKKEEISHELMVETIFNYGNLNDIRQLVNILGIKRLTEIYNGINGRKRLNYYPEVFNLFSLIIRKYAH